MEKAKKGGEWWFVLVASDEDDVFVAELGEMVGDRGADEAAAADDDLGRARYLVAARRLRRRRLVSTLDGRGEVARANYALKCPRPRRRRPRRRCLGQTEQASIYPMGLD